MSTKRHPRQELRRPVEVVRYDRGRGANVTETDRVVRLLELRRRRTPTEDKT